MKTEEFVGREDWRGPQDKRVEEKESQKPSKRKKRVGNLRKSQDLKIKESEMCERTQ